MSGRFRAGVTALAVATVTVACPGGSVLTDRAFGVGQSGSPATANRPTGEPGGTLPASNGNVVTGSPNGIGNGNTADPSTGVVAGPRLDANVFFMGVHINWDTDSGGVGGFIDKVGFVPSLCAGYITAPSDGSFELDKARKYADDVAGHGGTAISYAITAQVTSLSEAALAGLGNAVTYARSKNLAVYVRYGYEMNGNWSPAYHGGDPSIFLSQWAQAEKVVHAAGGAMVWSPNLSGSGDYNRWMPDPNTIDQVGLDAYHQKGDITAGEVDGFIGSIYPLVQKLQKPFVLTETAVVVIGNGSYRIDAEETEEKRVWLEQLVDANMRQKYPLYRGFVWFDYEKKESASGLSGDAIEWRNFAISVDPLAAAMVKAWYPTVFTTKAGSIATPASGTTTAPSGTQTATGAGTTTGATTTPSDTPTEVDVGSAMGTGGQSKKARSTAR